MKKLMIVAVLFSVALVSCNGGKKVAKFTEKDSLSYAMGLDFGNYAKRFDSTINTAVMAAAITDVFNNKPQMTQQDAYDFVNEYFNVRVPARNKAESQAYLDEVQKKNSKVKKTDSGLLYEIIEEGDMNVKAVNDNDEVVVNYRGTLKDGTEFDQNDSIKFALNRVIPGWTEGMKLVGKGGKVVLWVPSELGYGSRPYGQIPPNSALKFEVDLLDVVPAESAK